MSRPTPHSTSGDRQCIGADDARRELAQGFGGKIVGKEELRAYWTRQWGVFDPYVEALAITEGGEGKVRVRVYQIVKNILRDVLSDSEVFHVYTVNAVLLQTWTSRMRLVQLPVRLPHSHIDLTGYPPWRVRVGPSLENEELAADHTLCATGRLQ